MPEFISCEDNLPHLFGLYHPFASITSVLIMAVPLYWLRREPQFMTVALTLLFWGNLRMHMTGDFKFFHRVHSWYVFGSLFSLWSEVVNVRPGAKPRSDTISIVFGCGLACWFMFQVYMAHNMSWDVEHQIELTLEGICNVAIVLISGRYSYRVGLWDWHLFNCGVLVGIGVMGAVEPHVCDIPIVNWTYHMFVDHSMVAVLFFSVTGQRFELIKRVQRIKYNQKGVQ